MHRSHVADLTCRDLVELVTDYLDDALPAPERERFAAHVAACEGCDRYLQQIRATVALARRTRGLEDRPELAALLNAFRDVRRRTER